MEFKFIGWCNESGHDKIWVSLILNDHHYCAWGRRGGKLSFKDHGSNFLSIMRVEHQKKQKGYKEVDKFLLFSIFPNFEEKVEEELCFKMLSGKIR